MNPLAGAKAMWLAGTTRCNVTSSWLLGASARVVQEEMKVKFSRGFIIELAIRLASFVTLWISWEVRTIVIPRSRFRCTNMT